MTLTVSRACATGPRTTSMSTSMDWSPVIRRRGRFGAWRALVSLPSVLGGALLVLVLTAPLGQGQSSAILLWLGVGLLVSTKPGERLSVRLRLGFRPMSVRQRQSLDPVLAGALARCGLRSDAVDWYARTGRQPNAYAAGRRSIAVSEGALEAFLAGRLPADLLAAVLVHELGHHATRAGHYGLAATWFAAPGRLAFRLVVRLAVFAVGGRRPGGFTALIVAAGGAVAIVQTAQQRQWLSLVILSAVTFALVATPLLDALVNRASEYAADRHAVSVGAGPDLARALQFMAGPRVSRAGMTARLLDHHPSVDRRLSRLPRLAPGARQLSVALVSTEPSNVPATNGERELIAPVPRGERALRTAPRDPAADPFVEMRTR